MEEFKQHRRLSLMLFLLLACAHTFMDWDKENGLIAIEDGSLWETSSEEVVENWKPGDQITIKPDPTWFSSYHYLLSNQRENADIGADLNQAPLPFGIFSNWVIQIDPLSGHIYLQDGTMWCVHPKDQYDLRQWMQNDHVIIGRADSGYYPYILINADLDEYIRAMPY
ncbi:MAG: hypothetical protein RLZZ453_223 [Chlamydiota bacterium]|jgi:hypothetical protein